MIRDLIRSTLASREEEIAMTQIVRYKNIKAKGYFEMFSISIHMFHGWFDLIFLVSYFHVINDISDEFKLDLYFYLIITFTIMYVMLVVWRILNQIQ